MKKSIPFLFILLAPLFSWAQQNDPSTVTKIGDTAPSFDFSISRKQKANLKDYTGKIVLIDFFATWCLPCKYEMIRIQAKIWDKYKDNPKLALLFFGRDEDWDVILPFKEKNGFPFLMMPDKGHKIFDLYAAQYIPRVVLLDENQQIIYQTMGYDEGELKTMLKIIAEKLKPM